MTRYLHFDSYGNFVEEAPKEIYKDGRLILGYNKPSNEAMLLEDGYIPYNGAKSGFDMYGLTLVDGNIIEPEAVPVQEPVIFTKLQIRRAFRKLGIENQLDEIVSGDTEFAKDWQDAQEIDLNDEVFQSALNEYGIGEELIGNVINTIEEL